jgi:hypothetical protein
MRSKESWQYFDHLRTAVAHTAFRCQCAASESLFVMPLTYQHISSKAHYAFTTPSPAAFRYHHIAFESLCATPMS